MRFRRIIILILSFITLLIFLIEITDTAHLIFGITHSPVRWLEIFVEVSAIWFVGLPFLYFVRRWEANLKELEESKERSRKLLAVILKGAPASILFVKNRKAIWVNKSIEDILGWPVEKWLSEPSTAFCFPSREQFETVGRDIIYKDIARKGDVTYEYDYVHRNGSRVPTVVKMRPVNRNNLDEGFIFCIMDNSERKQREEMVRKLNQSLEERVRARTKELAEKLKELERFKEAAVERELRMKELRDEIERLKSK